MLLYSYKMTNARPVDNPFVHEICEQIFNIHMSGIPFDMHHYAVIIPTGGAGGWCKKGIIWDQWK